MKPCYGWAHMLVAGWEMNDGYINPYTLLASSLLPLASYYTLVLSSPPGPDPSREVPHGLNPVCEMPWDPVPARGTGVFDTPDIKQYWFLAHYTYFPFQIFTKPSYLPEVTQWERNPSSAVGRCQTKAVSCQNKFVSDFSSTLVKQIMEWVTKWHQTMDLATVQFSPQHYCTSMLIWTLHNIQDTLYYFQKRAVSKDLSISKLLYYETLNHFLVAKI